MPRPQDSGLKNSIFSVVFSTLAKLHTALFHRRTISVLYSTSSLELAAQVGNIAFLHKIMHGTNGGFPFPQGFNGDVVRDGVC